MYSDPKRWGMLFQSYVQLTMMDTHMKQQVCWIVVHLGPYVFNGWTQTWFFLFEILCFSRWNRSRWWNVRCWQDSTSFWRICSSLEISRRLSTTCWEPGSIGSWNTYASTSICLVGWFFEYVTKTKKTATANRDAKAMSIVSASIHPNWPQCSIWTDTDAKSFRGAVCAIGQSNSQHLF